MTTTPRTRRVVLPAFLLLGISALMAGCGNASEDPSWSAPQASIKRIAKVRPTNERQPEAVSAHLTYYGGPVISNVKVVQVLWGSAGNFPSYISGTSSPNMGTFYGGVTQSAYVDWLSEYDTTVSGGTNQTIGRGTFAGAYAISPSTTATTIDDVTIQSELVAQIAAGHLPANDANTLYMFNFAPGYTITMQGSTSCVQFCAYHGTTTDSANHNVYYGVLPDLGVNSGCNGGCGAGASIYDNQTSVASHEMAESITDPAVGLAANLAAPLAWYDSVNGEIGDICNAEQGSILGSDGVTYTVQKLWSNQDNACIVSKAVTTDFTLSDSPTSLSLAQGANGTSTVSTGVVGQSETVALSVSGLPSGASAAFSPASVTSGSSSTLTVTVGASTPAGTYTLTIHGTATSGTHTASLTLTVKSTGSNDFSLSVGSTSLSIRHCRQGSDAVHTAVTSGSAETVSLSATGLPTHTTVSFNPASVSSGASSTATFHVGCNAPVGTYSVTVDGTAASGSHAAALRLTVR